MRLARRTGLAVAVALWCLATPGAEPASVPSIGRAECVMYCGGGGRGDVLPPDRPRPSTPPPPPSGKRMERIQHLDALRRRALGALAGEIVRVQAMGASAGYTEVRLPAGTRFFSFDRAENFGKAKVPTGWTPGSSVALEQLGRAIAILRCDRCAGMPPSDENARFLADQAGLAIQGLDVQVSLESLALPGHLSTARLNELRQAFDEIASAEQLITSSRARRERLRQELQALTGAPAGGQSSAQVPSGASAEREYTRRLEEYAQLYEAEERALQERDASQQKVEIILLGR